MALANPPPMLKSVREKDFKENRLESGFRAVFLCVTLTYVAFSFIVAYVINGQ